MILMDWLRKLLKTLFTEHFNCCMVAIYEDFQHTYIAIFVFYGFNF